MHKFYEAAHKNALTLPPFLLPLLPRFGKLSRGAFVVAGGAAADNVYGYNCLSSLLDAKIDDDNLERSFGSLGRSSGKGCAFYDEAPLQQKQPPSCCGHPLAAPAPPDTAATLFMGCVAEGEGGGGGGGAAGGNDYERQHILCFNAVEIGQQQQQQ